ncbi:MAG: nodulation protein NfeD [Candidatus Bathyarchaeia archaeon]|jgi:membrane-bound serine protease (ClpP class)
MEETLLKHGLKLFRFFVLGSVFALFVLLAIGCFQGSAVVTSAQPMGSASGSVIIADFNVPVDSGASTFMARVVSTAQGDHAAAIVIEMNTPGGLVSDMQSIVNSIKAANSTGIPTYTFVVPDGFGASAGSYIAMACNRILMAPGSAIGPSTPIVVGGTALEQNHTQAFFLSYMQALAAEWGRNTTAVYYMVQSDEAFSATQAVEFHVADGTANSLSNAINELGLSGNPQTTLGENFYEQLLSALSNTLLDGILFLIGIVAIVLDFFHPTIVLTILGVIAIVAGLVGAEVVGASLLGIIILIVAAALIVLELKLGHGFALMAGVLLGAIGIYFLSFNLQYSPSPIGDLAILELSLIVIFGVLAGLYIRWVIGPIRRRTKLTGAEALIGKTGLAITELKPKGEVRVEGVIWRAQALSGEIEKGERVTVKAMKGLVLTVEKSQEAESRTATK